VTERSSRNRARAGEDSGLALAAAPILPSPAGAASGACHKRSVAAAVDLRLQTAEAETVLPIVRPKPETVPPIVRPEPETVPPIVRPEPEAVPPIVRPEPETVPPIVRPEPETVPPIVRPAPIKRTNRPQLLEIGIVR
jgi:hypothetical protein